MEVDPTSSSSSSSASSSSLALSSSSSSSPVASSSSCSSSSCSGSFPSVTTASIFSSSSSFSSTTSASSSISFSSSSSSSPSVPEPSFTKNTETEIPINPLPADTLTHLKAEFERELAAKREAFEKECVKRADQMRRAHTQKQKALEERYQKKEKAMMAERAKHINRERALMRKQLEEDRAALKAEKSALRAEISSREAALDRAKISWQLSANHLKAAQLPESECVVLNVGGQEFACTLADLRRVPDTFFANLFSGRWDTHTDKQGRLFINRSPRVFSYIMEYMRGEPVDHALLSDTEREALIRDADYYLFEALRDQLLAITRRWQSAIGYQLTDNGRVVERVAESERGLLSYGHSIGGNVCLLTLRQPTDRITIVRGTEIFSTPGIYTWRIRVLETAEAEYGSQIAIGVASGGGSARASNVLSASAANNGSFSGLKVWMFGYGGYLYTNVDDRESALSPTSVTPLYPVRSYTQGSEVEVRLHVRKDKASLRVKADSIGEFYYGKIAVDEPLCPCVVLPSKGMKVEILA